MDTPKDIVNNWIQGQSALVVVGLGYVGLPIAIEFSKIGKVIGYDISNRRIQELNSGYDRTGEISSNQFENTRISFTDNPSVLREATVIIVTVPTPITEKNAPDLSLLEIASKTIGENISQEVIVVYESTVYPGATEEVCIPILEQFSSRSLNKSLFVGYSPERISPADPVHSFSRINKVVSGSNQETLEALSLLYGKVIEAEIYKAPSIKVAEAAKVIENAQRDINVAFVNELSLIFDKLNISTSDVLEAAATKWNFLPFKPGLVGGHCIGVDPYYLAHKAREMGIEPDVILAGRRVNNHMANHISSKVINHLKQYSIKPSNARVGVMGLTFKENCPDIRNSKVFDIIRILKEHNIGVMIFDPHAHDDDIHLEIGQNMNQLSELHDLDILILSVAHDEFRAMQIEFLQEKLRNNKSAMIFDVKSIISSQGIKNSLVKIERL
jgi:UDP-N-acetyl-D-glucosamine/UDP-N-acetyl-D-galactosamine dehydrogenase